MTYPVATLELTSIRPGMQTRTAIAAAHRSAKWEGKS